LRIFVATSAAVAGRCASAAAEVVEVVDGAADVPPPLEQLGSATTLIATNIRLALRHLMVNI
jgi:hypothetical protein